MYIEYLPIENLNSSILNEPVNIEILDNIKADMLQDLNSYEALDISLKYNVNPVTEWYMEVFDKIFSKVETVADLINLARFTFNSKLGNKVIIFNLSCYFNCYGLLNNNCSCSKICYAGKLAIRQLNKTVSNYIFYEYVKRSGRLDILEYGTITAINKAVAEVKGSFTDIKSIRFNEVGEIATAEDLFYIELIYYYLRQYKGSLKAYTYSTSLHLKDLFKTSDITIRLSKGFNYKALDSSYYNSFSVIVEPETVLEAKVEAEAQGLKFILCCGTCKCCQSCNLKNTVVGFVNHSGTTKKQLELKIKQCQDLLKLQEVTV